MSTKTELDPEKDGIAHTNVYSQGRTALGRLLSNFAHTPFRHPKFGNFASMEAYWYWCGSGRTHDHLRRLHGASAKSAGMKCDTVPMPEDEFRRLIEEGLRCKIDQNIEIKQQLRDSHLPFVHYFVYGHRDKRPAVVHKDKHDWQMQLLETIRSELQGRPVQEVDPSYREHTLAQIKADGYEASGLTHHGEAPSADDLHKYARVLHWSSAEAIGIRTGPASWVIARKAPVGPSTDEIHWDNA